jgi:hypothetical protein
MLFGAPKKTKEKKNNLITPQQFGSRSGYSTIHPMSLLLNKVTEALKTKKHSIIIFFDFKKAFNTFNHTILFKKIHITQNRNQRH